MERNGDHALISNRSIPDNIVIPVLAYRDVREAVDWLSNAFGFRERLQIFDHRSQMITPEGGAVVATDSDAAPPAAHSVMVRVPNVDAHYERAKAAGATIVREPETHPYGERQYTARDLGGHAWTFTESVEDVDPGDWGGVMK